MYKSYILVFALGFSTASQAKVSSDEIKTLVLKLRGGDYSGNYKGQPCTVSVVDNGGDGSGYFVRVMPSSGTENFFAEFTVTKDQEGQVSDPSADSIGVNFHQSLTLIHKPDGSLYVRVTNSISGEIARGYCAISTH